MRRAHLSRSPIGARALTLLALVFAVVFAWGTASARAESWGEIKQFPLETGEDVGQIGEHLVRFAAGSDGSYYVLTGRTNIGEFALQRYDEGKLQAQVFFNRPKEKEETNKVGSEGVDATLAVDPSRNRAYVLLVYERRAFDEKEEEEEEKLEKEEEKFKDKKHFHPVFPPDEEQPAAGSLYAFEYSTAKKELLSKTSKGKAGEPPIPQLTREELHGQGEGAKEALLDPRGMAVDPANGDLVISGNQDEEPNEEVEKKAEKQCRPALQFVKVESGGAGEIGKLAPTARYIDKEGKALFGNIGPHHGCGEEEEEEAIAIAPASPVFAPDGSVLGYEEDENIEPEGVIWQLSPAGADAEGPGEHQMTPKELFVDEAVPTFVPSTGAEKPETVMSMVDEGSTAGSLYLSGSYKPSSQPAPLLLHYSHPVGEEPSVSEVGWTAGAGENENLGPEPCDLHKLSPAGPAMLGGVSISGKHGLLALTSYQENIGAGHEQVVKRAEVVQFGEGGNTKGCPVPKITTPVQSFKGKPTNELPLGETVEVSSVIGSLANPSAAAKSVKWIVKITPTHGSPRKEEHEEQFGHDGLHGEEEGEGTYLALMQKFSEEGTYEIEDVVHSDDLAAEVLAPAVIDKVTVKGPKLLLKPQVPVPPEVVAHEGNVKLAVEVKVSPEEDEEGLKIKHVIWEFGDGTIEEQTAPPDALTSPLAIEHEFGRCGAGKKTICKVKVTVEAETTTGVLLKETATKLEVPVKENKKEEEEETTTTTTTSTSTSSSSSASSSSGTTTSTTATTTTTAATTTRPSQGVLPYITSFSGSFVSVSSSGSITVTISCPSGGACSGTLTLQTAGPVATSSNRHAKKKVLVLASGSFSLSAGSKSVTLHLSSIGKSLLSHSHGKLPAKLTILSEGSGGQPNNTSTHGVTLHQVSKRKHK